MLQEILQPNNIVKPNRLLRRLAFLAMNQKRQQYDKIGYVLFTLEPTMPSLPEPRGWLRRRIQGNPPLSIAELDRALRLLAEDDRANGAILHLRGAQMPLADLQSLRNSILHLRAQGKRVICYAQDYDTLSYYIASAADSVLLQPGGSMMTTGLRLEATFFKDTLKSIGVEIEAVQISPFKSALDQFARNEISPEASEQFNWLLDSRYQIITEGIAEGRGISVEAAQALIDGAPYTDKQALDAGYVDALVNEEGFAQHLTVKPADIMTWDVAQNRVSLKWQELEEPFVALLPITGMIVNGESENPPVDIPLPLFGGPRAGDLTIVQRVRRLMDNDKVVAVVVYVDSPGGSATASEAMASALDELAKTRPVVVYMNNVAASGGYYVATPAQWIVAQPGTITGSIGVINGKVTTRGMFEKLHANRVAFTRGANADFLSDHHPLTDSDRTHLRNAIDSIYGQFTRRVAESRNMTQEAVDAVGGGRVWTGAQALEHGLVDELGDLRTALNKARQLADLPADAPLVLPGPGRHPEILPPKLAESVDPAASLRYLHSGMRHALSGRAQMLLPFYFD